MTRDAPDGARLLALARAALLETLLPALPKEKQFEARLVANAMAIATRELTAGRAPLDADRAALAGLVGDSDSEITASHETRAEALERLSWRVAAEIRSGRRDADPALYEVLLRGVTWRLAEANPGALPEAQDKDA